MSSSNSKRSPKSAVADGFSGINLTPQELASVRARMAQAEAIADGMVAAYRGIVSAGHWMFDGLARRVRGAFMKPVHH